MKQSDKYILRHQEFRKLIEEHKKKPLKSDFNRNGLSPSETKLIKARIMILKKQFDEALQLLEEMNVHESFLNGDKHSLICYILHLKEKYDLALYYGRKAISYFEQSEDKERIFITTSNYAYLEIELGLLESAKETLKDASKLAKEGPDLLHIYKLLGQNEIKLGNIEQGLAFLEKSYTFFHKCTEHQQLIHLVGSFELYFKAEEYERCLSIIEDLSGKYSVFSRDIFVFEKTLLDYYINNVSIPKPRNNLFKEETYYNKLLFLFYLQRENFLYANKVWDILKSSFPKDYVGELPNSLEYRRDSNSLFSKVIDKFLMKVSTKKTNFEEILQSKKIKKGSKKAKCIQALCENLLRLDKESLIEFVWNDRYEFKYDNRLYTLIRRLRNENGIDVKYKDGVYVLDLDC